MKINGTIIETSLDGNKSGKIVSEEYPLVNFDYLECAVDYHYVRQGDLVKFEVFEDSNGLHHAFDLEFVSNPSLLKIEKLYNSNSKIKVTVTSIYDDSLETSLFGIVVTVPKKYLSGTLHLSSVRVGDIIEIILIQFGNNRPIIGSSAIIPLIADFQSIRKAYENFEIVSAKVISKDNNSIICELFGIFCILPFDQLVSDISMISIESSIDVVVIKYSLSVSIILSQAVAQNYNAYLELNESFKKNALIECNFIGHDSSGNYFKYKGIKLLMPNKFCLTEYKEGVITHLRILNPRKRNIPVVCCNDFPFNKIGDAFYSQENINCTVIQTTRNSLIVDLFGTEAYIPIEHIELNTSEIELQSYIGKVVTGRMLNLFDHFNRTTLSLTKVIREEAILIDNYPFKVGDFVPVKISDKLFLLGIPLRIQGYKGFIMLEDIIPLSIIPKETESFKLFLKELQSVFKRRSEVVLKVKSIDKEFINIKCDFYINSSDNLQKAISIIRLLADPSRKQNLFEFYKSKTFPAFLGELEAVAKVKQS